METELFDREVSKEIFNEGAIRPITVRSCLARRLVRGVAGVIGSREIPKTETIMTCFKVSSGDTICSYAYLYSQCSDASHFKHMYYTCCPTYSSQDGEYRHRVSSFSHLDDIDKKYSGLLEAAEMILAKYIESEKVSIEAMFCFPFNCKVDTKAFKENINTLRLAIKFFAIAWLLDVDSIKRGALENHINPAYEHIMGSVIDRADHDSLADKIDDEVKYTLIGKQNIDGAEYGQKFFPLTYKEITGSGDIFFPTWHELIIGDKCADLLLNFISPSFPAPGSWTFIQNVSADVYDNAAMQEKYAHSVRVADIIRQIHEADKLNYVEKQRGRGFINNKFMELSKNLHKSIEYAEANIRLTDVLLCGFSEYAGRTFRDIPLLPAERYKTIFGAPVHFERHMFEFIYSIYCMNSKLGIMHGDLHVNNITLKLETPIAQHKDPKVAYIVEGRVYTFPHNFAYSCIIDFSRAIYAKHEEIEEAFGVDYTRRYLKTQTYRVLALFNKYMPRFFMKFKKQIMESAFFDKFPLFFKVMTAMDPYCISTNMMSLLLTTGNKISVDPSITKLLTKIAHESESLIIKLLRGIFSGDIKTPDSIEWPCLTILRAVFGGGDPGFEKDANYYDVFNSANKIKYNIRDRDNLGPLVGGDILKKIGMQPANIKKFDPETEKVLELTKRFEESDDDFSDEEWIY